MGARQDTEGVHASKSNESGQVRKIGHETVHCGLVCVYRQSGRADGGRQKERSHNGTSGVPGWRRAAAPKASGQPEGLQGRERRNEGVQGGAPAKESATPPKQGRRENQGKGVCGIRHISRVRRRAERVGRAEDGLRRDRGEGWPAGGGTRRRSQT